MNIKIKTILLAVLLVAISGIGGYLVRGEGSLETHEMPNGEHMMNSSMGMNDEMQGMMSALSGKEGDELDEAFLKEMIVHHQGAVEMAQVVLKSGKHPELKQMAEGIVSAQTEEIAQMKTWQAAWYSK